MFRSRWMKSSAWLACVGVGSLGVTMAMAAEPENLRARVFGGGARDCGADATISIVIFTDNYGSETSWEVTENPGGTEIALGGPLSSDTLYSIEVCVDPAGCYDFTIYDSYGDGICCSYGTGYYEVRYEGGLVGSGGDFGDSETVANIGGSCVVPTGACCEGMACTGTTDEASCAGDWYEGGDCATYDCPTTAGLTCPDSLFSQNAHGADDSWSLGTSEVDANGSNYLRSEHFSGVISPICDIHWWGTQMILDGDWVNCSESDPTFIITFYADSAGQPGAVVQSYTVQAAVSPTDELLSGIYELKYFSVDTLSPCTTLSDGWVSIQGVGDTDCWFMWDSSPDGDGGSCIATDGVQDCTGYLYDNAVCLTGEYVPSYGACCDDSTGVCNDGVEIINCTGRFEADTLCSALDPLCGAIPGACCEDAVCTGTGEESQCNGTWFEGEQCPGFSCPGCPDATILVTILTDTYGSETSWEVTDNGTGAVIASGSGLASSTLYETEVCVDSNGCHDFTIYDSYGDGIFSPGGYEVAYNGVVVASTMGGLFTGSSETVALIGGACVLPEGACCESETCTGTTTEPDCAGVWFSGEDCATFTCPALPGVCPSGTGFGQTPFGPDDDWTFGTSEADADGSSYLRHESYSVTESICDIHWWGLQLYNDGIAWSECTDSNPVFEVKFYADAGGVPGAEVASYTVTPTITPTGVVFAGLYDMLYYSVPLLAPCVTQNAGFFSIQGLGDTDCWFLWAGSAVGDASSCLDSGAGSTCGVFDESDFDLSVCLTTEYTPTFGACCDDGTGVCNDNVEAINCAMGNRFEADTLCADLDPACGVVLGACCDSLTGACLGNMTESDCMAQADRTWHNGQDCAGFTCPTPPLSNDDCGDATPIGEVTNLPFDTSTATNDGGGTCMTSPNIWYDYLASCTGEVHVSLCGSGYDTKMAAYDGPNCSPLDAEIGCNDDSPCTGRALQSELWWDATAGNHYLIEVGGYSSNTGAGILNITCTPPPDSGACCVFPNCTDDVAPGDCTGAWFGNEACANVTCPTPGDDCTAPMSVTLGTADLPYTNNNTNCGRGDVYDDSSTAHCLYYYDSGEEMIYELNVTETMTVKLTMDPHGTTWSGFAIGNACPPTDDCIAADYSSSSDPKFIDCVTLAPGTYYIQVDTWSSPDCIPDFTLTIEQCPDGGACCDAESNCTDVGSAEECPDLYLGNGTSCAADSCPSGNDICETATPVNVGDTVAGSTIGANNSGTETCGTSNTAADVWYSVIGNGNRLTAALCDSTWDTKITVFTDGCETLTCVGGNDDSCYGAASAIASLTADLSKPIVHTIPSRMNRKDLRALVEVEHIDPAKRDARALQSEIQWCSELGREYLIMVHGYSSNEGDFILDVMDGTSCAPPDNDDCGNVTEITSVPYEDLGVGMDLASDDDNVDPSCDSSGNSGYANNGLWWSYTPPEGCDATIGVAGEDTIIAVWTGADCTSLSQEECSDPQTLNTWLNGGTQYWILVSYWYGYSEPDGPIDFTFDCVVPPKGACCTDTGCIFDTQPVCAGAGGSYVGDDTACAGPPDCNNTGLIDECDIESGASDDCNNNGFPDECDIADSTSDDCQPDGIPDECQLSRDGSRAVVVDEGFEGAFPPAGWVNTALDANGPWQMSDNMAYVHAGAQSAIHPWNASDYADSYLLTPVLDITTGSVSVWTLGCSGQGWCDSYDIDVMIVIGAPGGGDDIFVANLNQLYTDYYTTWVNGVYDLTPLLPGGDFRIGFRYHGLDGDLGVIDDVLIEGDTGPLANDCNGNGVPDDCDPDLDGDGIPDDCDECTDTDGDGNHDAGITDPVQTCPEDICQGFDDYADVDGDTEPDGCDNCPEDYNTAQTDSDGDDVGDVCDNCPDDFNPNQVDTDGDGNGNACDICEGGNDNEDADGDTVPDFCDVCGPEGSTDDDLAPGSQDDADGDGVLNCNDLCDGVDDAVFGPDCVGKIPTMSTWGLVVLALLLLVGSKVYFGRRRAATV